MSARNDTFAALFAPAPAAPPAASVARPWTVLLVDDDPDVHAALRLALRDAVIEGRSLHLLTANSAAEARRRLAEHPGVALVLLDVVMESERAGLDLVRYIRHDLRNHAVQVVMLTGQPGYTPQRAVVAEYGIDGHRLKSELSSDAIYVSVYAALRAHQAYADLERHRRGLELLVDERTAELAASNAELRLTQSAMNKVGIGVTWIDVASGRFLYTNEEACRQLGRTRAEMLGLTLGDVNPAYARRSLERTLRESFPGQQSARIEYVHRRKDGSTYPAEVTACLEHCRDGDRVIAFFSDITARKQAEAELVRARDRAEAASRAKDSFLVNASHELRTPMNAVLGLTELALAEAHEHTQGERLQKVKRAAHQLLEVITDVCEMARIEADRLDERPASFQLGPVFDDALRRPRSLARDKGLDLQVEWPTGMREQRVMGHPRRLAGVLERLVENAVKFTEAGGVTVRPSLQPADGGQLLLRCEVQDTGIGVPAGDQSRLFAPFEQGDPSLTRRHGGLGLGLAIGKRLAQLMGGDVGVNGAAGGGSTFWFTARLRTSAADGDPS